MAEVKQSPANSPSKSIDRGAKQNWKGGVNHGNTNPKGVLDQSPTKHPLPISPSKGSSK